MSGWAFYYIITDDIGRRRLPVMPESTKETSLATGLRITFAIIGAILIMICSCAAALRFTVLNDTFWGDFLKSDDFADLLKEEMGLNSSSFRLYPGSDVTVDFTDDDAQDEFVSIIVDEYLELLIEGDRSMDRDRFEDFFDEYEDELFTDSDVSGSQKREAVESMVDMLEEAFENFDSEEDNEEAFGFMHAYMTASRRTFVTMIVTGVMLIIMVVVLLIVHKNKFRPVRAMGIAMTCAQALSTMGWGFVAIAFGYANDVASEEEEELVQVFVNRISVHVGHITAFMAVTLLIGIVLIIIGAVGAGKADRRMIEE